ncbi:MAG: HAD-IIIA family hydrolase [Gammaproteobacteria bacterium]|nr:HAD-IIIA family hydrolase [Gammaproteobacteria bacterium]
MTEFKLLVFDWDGTLMDSAARIVACFNAAIMDVGLEPLPDAAIRNIIGLGLREALDQLAPGADIVLRQQLVDRYRHHYLYANQTPSPLFPGADAMVRELGEQGYFLAVATGKGRQGLNRVLEETGCKGLFHATRCADETFSKPHPQMLLELMSELNVSPGETLMIGDTEYDLQMAKNAGTVALGVSYGAHERDRLLKCEPLACLDSFEELRGWLSRPPVN